MLFFEEEKEKDDPVFFAVHDTDGEADAYATYRVKHEWTDSLPNLELTVRQLVATRPQAYADIWRYLFDIDLVHRVKAWNRPIDEPLFFLMQEPRRLRFRTSDALARAARGRAGGPRGARLRRRRADRRRRRGRVLSVERRPVRARGDRRRRLVRTTCRTTSRSSFRTTTPSS